MSDPVASQELPQEGLVIIFDEPRRAPILHGIADDKGLFRDAFSAVDWPFDSSSPELCVLSFDGKYLSHVALAEAGRRAVTAKKGVTFSHVEVCSPLPLATLAKHLTFALDKVVIRASSPEGHRVGGETWAAFFRAVRGLAPEMAQALIRLDAVRRERGASIAGAYEIHALERDAIGTALGLAGMDRSTVLRTASTPQLVDGALQASIQTMDPRHQEPQAKFSEADALAHDAAMSALWVEGMPAINLRGVCNYAKGRRLLRVYNINNQVLETTLGVDLLYHNVARHSFVLIQYKLLKVDSGGAVAIYRVDDRMEAQLKLMDSWANRFPVFAARKLIAEPFFWKICAPIESALRGPELVPGWYFSRPWMRELISSPDARGPRDGVRITDTLAREGLSNSLFTDLVRGTFIGSAGDDFAVFEHMLAVEVDMGRSIIVAVEGERA